MMVAVYKFAESFCFYTETKYESNTHTHTHTLHFFQVFGDASVS